MRERGNFLRESFLFFFIFSFFHFLFASASFGVAGGWKVHGFAHFFHAVASCFLHLLHHAAAFLFEKHGECEAAHHRQCGDSNGANGGHGFLFCGQKHIDSPFYQNVFLAHKRYIDSMAWANRDYTKRFQLKNIKLNKPIFLVIGSIIGIDTNMARSIGQNRISNAFASPPEIYFNGNLISEIQINGDNQRIRIPSQLIKRNQSNEVTIKTGRNLMQTAYVDYDDIEFMNLFFEN